MKIKKLKIMLPVILVIMCVAGALTFVLTSLKVGFGSGFLYAWLKAFVPTAFVIAPIGITSTFVLDKVVNYFFKKQSKLTKKIILSIMMGCTIEFFVSLITMITSFHYEHFLVNWIVLYIKSLPMGFAMGLFMSFIFKPWMGKRVHRVKNLHLELAK